MSFPPTPLVGAFAQFMLDCQAAAQTVPSVVWYDEIIVLKPTNVFIGHYEWLVEQEFYQRLPHEGFELFIGGSEGEADNYALTGDFKLPCELFYTIPSDIPSSLIPIEIMKSYLNVAWSSMFTQWVSGGNRNPLKTIWEKPHIRRHEKPFVVSTSFTLTQKFVPDQASDPFLMPPVIGN